MTQTTVRKTKWFLPWQDQEEEVWLEEMSKQGLHLLQAENLGKYLFEQGAPQVYVYRLDYREASEDEQHYLQIFEDLGWQRVTTLSGWQYFRQPAKEGKKPEIFTDADTKIQKYARVKNMLVFYMAICALFMIVYFSSPENEPGSRHWWISTIINSSGILLSGSAISFLVFGYYKLEKRIRELRNL